MHRRHSLSRPDGVVELRDLVGLSRIDELVRITGRLKRRQRDVVGSQMIGMGVLVLLVGIADEDLRSCPTDLGDQAADRLIDLGVPEGLRMGVRLRRRHPRVPVAPHHDLVVPDDRGSRSQLCRSAFLQRLAFGQLDCRVVDLPLLATGATHEDRVDVLGCVPGDRGRPLGRLVIRVGVDGHDASLD